MVVVGFVVVVVGSVVVIGKVGNVGGTVVVAFVMLMFPKI